jgi:hypothetical protein
MIQSEQLYQTAYALDQKGRTIDAIDKYQEVLSVHPEHIQARVRLAFIYRMIGGYVSMKRELKAAMDHDISGTAIVFDEVFFGQGQFPEYELYVERTLQNKHLWVDELAPGWYVDKKVIDYHVLLSVKNEERVYAPDAPVDAEILVFNRKKAKVQYLLTRRRHIDGNFYNFLCRFSDGKQFRAENINNDSGEEEVFSNYINTFLREFEIVF